MRATLDIETALYNVLIEGGHSASAHMVPKDLGTALPHVHVVRTGGNNNDMVIDLHYVDFDVYASDMADAMTTASNLCAWVRSLAGNISGVPCYSSEVTTLPYNNPDPLHPTTARATLKAQITTRTMEATSDSAEFVLVSEDNALITDKFEILKGEE